MKRGLKSYHGRGKSAFFVYVDFQKFIAFSVMLFIHPSICLSIHPTIYLLIKKKILARTLCSSESFNYFSSADYFAVCIKLIWLDSVPIDKGD